MLAGQYVGAAGSEPGCSGRPGACPTVPMKLLDDVGVWLYFERGDRKTYIVGSITADRYLTVPAAKLPAIRAFMGRLDGTRTLGQVREELVRELGLKVDVEALHR